MQLRDKHLASGYGSDDEPPAARRKAPVQGFGALPGDHPLRGPVSRLGAVDYTARQNAAGPRHEKVRFSDAVAGGGRQGPPRLSRAQTQGRMPFEVHCALLRKLGHQLTKAPAAKSDLQLLRESHRFLRSADDDDGTWEARLAQRYYDRLFKEYVICDLAGYKKGNVGFRWRTEREVLQGKGHFRCGHKVCESREFLQSYEVDFKYREAGESKRALVKARLCEECAQKLHYRRIKAQQRRAREERRRGAKRARTGELGEDGGLISDSGDDCGHPEERSDAAAVPERSASTEDDPGEPAGGRDKQEERRLLAALAWKGPDPETRTRGDDFDDYLNEIFM